MIRLLTAVVVSGLVTLTGYGVTCLFGAPALGASAAVGIGAAVLSCWVLPWMIGRRVERFADAVVEGKSRVLRGASVEVHGVEPLPIGVLDVLRGGATDEVEGPTRLVLADLTVTPIPRVRAPFAAWDPSELLVVAPSPPGTRRALADEQALGCVERVEIFRDDAFHEDDEGRITGTQRLRLTLRCHADAKRVALRYWLESLGELELPAPVAVAAPDETPVAAGASSDC